jgi:hypothetical protein
LRWCWRGDKVPAMTEVATTENRPAQRNGRDPALVTSTALARHFGVTQTYVSKLMAEGVIERRPDGLFDQDVSRLKYLTHLRSENRRSARTEADAAHVKAKTEMLQLRLMEKKKQLIPATEHEAFVETLTGLFLTGLSGFAARCGGRDLAVRREIDRAVYDLRVELSHAANRMADERGEPDEPA